MLYDKFRAQIDNPDIKSIEVTVDDFQEIIKDPATIFGPLKPQPPVSKVVNDIKYREVKIGFCKKEMQPEHEHKEIHYDFRDPDYLEDLREYKKQEKKINELYFYGKRVVLKETEKPGADLQI